jgi:hypothetical protein
MNKNNPNRFFLITNKALNYCLVVLVVVCCIAVGHAMLKPSVKLAPVRSAGGGIPVVDIASMGPVCAAKLRLAALVGDPNLSELRRACNSVVPSTHSASNTNGDDR